MFVDGDECRFVYVRVRKDHGCESPEEGEAGGAVVVVRVVGVRTWALPQVQEESRRCVGTWGVGVRVRESVFRGGSDRE